MSINGNCHFCLNAKENINHIFKKCDLATNVWYTSNNKCSSPMNTNMGILDWLEYLWLDKSWFMKNLDDILEKVITILLAIWTHRTNVVFGGDNCNPCFLVELANKSIYETTVIRNVLTFPLFQKM